MKIKEPSKVWVHFEKKLLKIHCLYPRFKQESIDCFPEVNNHIRALYEVYSAQYTENPSSQIIDDDEDILFTTPTLSSNDLTSYLNFTFPNSINKSKFDIIAWWKLNQNEYPIVSKMAKDFLSIQPSSIPSEELFSQSSFLITEKRSNLHEVTIRACMSLKSWNKIFF